MEQTNSSGANTVLLVLIIAILIIAGVWGYRRYSKVPASSDIKVEVSVPTPQP